MKLGYPIPVGRTMKAKKLTGKMDFGPYIVSSNTTFSARNHETNYFVLFSHRFTKCSWMPATFQRNEEDNAPAFSLDPGAENLRALAVEF